MSAIGTGASRFYLRINNYYPSALKAINYFYLLQADELNNDIIH